MNNAKSINSAPKGCGKAGNVYKGIKGNYWYTTCGEPYLWEKTEEGLIPLNLYLCPDCKILNEQGSKA